jgi:multidrug transporter EmrE-like cation transporter
VSGLAAGLALAVAGSVALNASYLLQHAGTRDAPPIDLRHPLRTVTLLLGSGRWLAGMAAGLAGWALFLAGLAQAPLSLVQAFAAGGLALTVPAAARFFGERLAPRERLAMAAMVVALALLGVGAASAIVGAVPAGRMAAFTGVAALVAGGAALAARGPRRGRGLALAAGVLYGVADAGTKAVAITAGHGLGIAGAILGPWGAIVAVASIGAFLCFQRALQIGPVVPVTALMTGGTTVAGVLGGLLVFGDPLGGPALAALHLTAFALATVAGLVLAATQARAHEPERGETVPRGRARRHLGWALPGAPT